MSIARPKLFIGSSSQAYDRGIPNVFRDHLSEYADVYIWKSVREFQTRNSTMEALYAVANEYDFGLFILSEDDLLIMPSNSGEYCAPRDNVVLELGLFSGALGSDRTFCVVESPTGEKKMRVPTDLDGRTMPRIDTTNDDLLRSSVCLLYTSPSPRDRG